MSEGRTKFIGILMVSLLIGLGFAVGRTIHTHTRAVCCTSNGQAAAQRTLHIVCAFPIAQECRKLEWWPE